MGTLFAFKAHKAAEIRDRLNLDGFSEGVHFRIGTSETPGKLTLRGHDWQAEQLLRSIEKIANRAHQEAGNEK